MKVIRIKENNPLFDQVVELGNVNKKTLGFLPVGAYRQKAIEGKLLVAIDDAKVLGYLLFDYHKRASMAYIVHLCVDNNHRNKHVAHRLLKELETVLDNRVGGIRVTCRKDYDASTFWPKLGFEKTNEKPGRSKKGTILELWRKNIPLFLDLFSKSPEVEEPSIKACLDCNLLIDAIKMISAPDSASHAIFEDWLSEVVEFYVSPEIDIEASRDTDENRRAKLLELAGRHILISSSNIDYRNNRILIKDLFTDKLQDQSDLSHLAWCGAANLDVLVTADEKLQHKSAAVYDRIGVRVVYPSDLTVNVDRVTRVIEYQPKKFGESNIIFRRLVESDFDDNEDALIQMASEGKRAFFRQLRRHLSRPKNTYSMLITYEGKILGLICYEIVAKKKLAIHLMRLTPSSYQSTIVTGLVKWVLEKSIEENTRCIEIADHRLSRSVTRVCFKMGFHESEGILVRLSYIGCLDIDATDLKLNEYEKANILPPSYCKRVRSGLKRAVGANDNSLLLELERSLWPLKLKGLDLPAYGVSIQPQFAMHLFDRTNAASDLFGGKANLMLNVENAYYRSTSGLKLKAPSRILWYVSQGRGRYHFQGSQSIKACSYLDEIHIDKAKVLYDRFQHLGIFEWKDVLSTARNEALREIMAFVFSRTEVFDYPIPKSSLDQLYQEEYKRDFNIQGPIRIDDTMFWRIYNRGVKRADECR